MDVELLVVPDCPNESATAVLLRTALDEVGLTSIQVRTTVIRTRDDAEQRGFPGSPTVLVDGTDPFTPSGPPPTPALGCRMYVTASGPTGTPDPGELRRAIKRAAAR